jgi:hypothetical protein
MVGLANPNIKRCIAAPIQYEVAEGKEMGLILVTRSIDYRPWERRGGGGALSSAGGGGLR